MINITLEQIDAVMQRANVSYAEAKLALEEAHGDVLDALLKLEQKKNNTNSSSARYFTTKLKSCFNRMNRRSISIKKDDRTYIDLPLVIAIILFACCFPFSLIALVVAMVLGFKVNILT